MSAPGLWIQRLTTKEPDIEQIQVAIASLKAALPGEYCTDDVVEDLSGKAVDTEGTEDNDDK